MILFFFALWLQHPPTPIPHGDHTPKHGGVFFMAPDVFHHVEGTLHGKEFRLYVYDNFTQPMDARRFQARVGDRGLESGDKGEFLKLQLDEITTDPPEVTVFLRFTRDGPEERFDFIFMAPSVADVLPDFVIPEKPEEVFREILTRDGRIQALMTRGAWTDLFIPALEAKDLALTLNVTANKEASIALKKIVRAAWLLDAWGDLGNRVKVEAAYRLFEAGISDLKKVYER